MALISDHDGVLHYGVGGDIWSGVARARLNRVAIVREWLAEAWRNWSYRRSIYRTERALGQLSNRELHDLGINRTMITAAARAAADREFGLANPDGRTR